MKYKKSMIIILLAIFLISIASASASDANDTALSSEDTGQIELSGDEITGDNIQANNEETASAKTDSEILAAGQCTYSYLRDQIGSGGNKTLTEGTYTYNNDGGTITITASGVIDGNGAVIDMAGSDIRAFYVTSCDVTIKNLTIKNANFKGDGGAIYNNQGALTLIGCTFTNNTATTEKGGAIYNYEGALKIVDSRFEKNSRYDRAIYNYGEEDYPFKLTIINATMVEDKVTINFNGNERRLDDKRDIDLLTTEVNASIPEIVYEGRDVLINVSGIDEDFTGSITVNITNTIYNTNVEVSNGKGHTIMNLDINRYTARFKNIISLSEEAFEREDSKPYLEINFKVASNSSFSALEYMISKAKDNITLNRDYIYDSKTDSAYINIKNRKLTVYGNGYSISGSANNGDTLFLIEDDSDVRMENLTLENGHAQSRSHLAFQIRMGGAIFVSRSNLTIINSTIKNCKAAGGSGGAIFSEFSTLKIIDSNFTNNEAANGENLYVQGGDGAYILNSNIGQETIYNEPDWDNEDTLAEITILNDLNAILYIPNHVRGDETSFDITQPENLNAIANLTVNNDAKGSIQIADGHANANLNLDSGAYTATITTPDIVYYSDAARNLTCTYLSATIRSNEFTVMENSTSKTNASNGTDNQNQTIKPASEVTGKTAAANINTIVKKATPKITAKNKTYKLKAKTKKFTITLKDNKGKPIRNAKVTLKVNGKTYTATTNSKGKATFKIGKLNKKGTYKATVTFKANKYYNKATKKVKITIK